MDLSDMRKQFLDGALEAAAVQPVPKEYGAWLFVVQRTDGNEDYMTLARSNQKKIYKSLKAVAADAERVGFTDVKLRGILEL